MMRSAAGYGLALVCLLAASGSLAGSDVQPTAVVETVAVRLQQLDDTLTVFGQVQPDPDYIVSLAPPTAGVVTRVSARVGQRVAAGDEILTLATAPDTSAQFQQAAAAVNYAQGQLLRTRKLRAEQLATRDQVQMAERALSDAQAQLRALRKLGAGQAGLVFRSPFAGVVTAVSTSQGTRVAANTTVALLAQQQHLVVTLGIEPEDARKLVPGTPVKLAPVFDPDVDFTSVIAAVHALINPATGLVDAVVKVPDNAADALTLNATVRAAVALDAAKLLVIPRPALRHDGDNAYVFRVRDGHAQRVDVKVVKLSGARIGVRGDLTAGDKIITTGAYQVDDGMTVRVRNE